MRPPYKKGLFTLVISCLVLSQGGWCSSRARWVSGGQFSHWQSGTQRLVLDEIEGARKRQSDDVPRIPTKIRLAPPENVYIGDRFRVGETELMVTEPRMPCYKLGIKFGRADIIKRFLASRRTGFYFAVVREGMVGASDAIKLIGQEQQDISVADITRLYAFEKDDLKSLRRAIEVEALPENWRGYFQHQLEKQIG